MSLTESLKKLNQENRNKIPNEALAVMDKATQEIQDRNLAQEADRLGQKFPPYTLPNATDNSIALEDLWKKQPLVITFYRGGWCPYCNMQLRTYQEHLDKIKAKGGMLIAITPETPNNSLSTKEKNDLAFEVLSDINNTLAKKLNLVFELPEALKNVYNTFGLDLKKHNDNEDYELPMPATYVINNEGIIKYQFIDEDYTKRADVETILTALEEA